MLGKVRQSRENSDNRVSTSTRYGVLSNRCDEAQLNFLLKQSYWTAVKIFMWNLCCVGAKEEKFLMKLRSEEEKQKKNGILEVKFWSVFGKACSRLFVAGARAMWLRWFLMGSTECFLIKTGQFYQSFFKKCSNLSKNCSKLTKLL